MRHVRILALCLMAIFAMSATTLVIASPASASCDETCQKEKQEAKEAKAAEKEGAKEQKALAKWETKRLGDPFGTNSYGAFKACEYTVNEEVPVLERPTDCFIGITNGGKNGGFFEYGKVKVPLSKSIALQGYFRGAGSEIEVYPAVHGYKTLDAPPLPVDEGINVLTPRIQENNEWPAALSESWKQAVANKETAIYATVEMAGTECFYTPGSCLDTENLIFEEGTAFNLPLKVKLTGPWLEKLESGPCYIGSDEAPDSHPPHHRWGWLWRGHPIQHVVHHHHNAPEPSGRRRLENRRSVGAQRLRRCLRSRPRPDALERARNPPVEERHSRAEGRPARWRDSSRSKKKGSGNTNCPE